MQSFLTIVFDEIAQVTHIIYLYPFDSFVALWTSDVSLQCLERVGFV